MKLIMTKGLPASGKSTWAIEQVTQHGYKRVSKDSLRLMLDANKWSKKNEHFIILLRNTIAAETLKLGQSIIIDDTNLNPEHEKDLRVIAEEAKAEFEIKDFTDVPLEECLKRDKDRPNYVGEAVIKKMHRQFLKKGFDRGTPLNPIIYDPKLTYCVIFDLDGTLACMGDRSPYDGKSCAVDKPNQSVVKLAHFARSAKIEPEIIIFSGRNGDSEPETRDWLHKNAIPFDALYMRKPGDFRKDDVIKEEMFNAYIKDKFNVLFVVDDRDSVVTKWREMGLTCLQVNFGDF